MNIKKGMQANHSEKPMKNYYLIQFISSNFPSRFNANGFDTCIQCKAKASKKHYLSNCIRTEKARKFYIEAKNKELDLKLDKDFIEE